MVRVCALCVGEGAPGIDLEASIFESKLTHYKSCRPFASPFFSYYDSGIDLDPA